MLLHWDHADRCEKFRAIPGKQVQTAARGFTIRVGSLTCLRRDGAEGHLGKPAKCYNANCKRKQVWDVGCCECLHFKGGNS